MNKPNKDRHAYTLLTGEQLSIGVLSEVELGYLEKLKNSADSGKDYFDLLRVIRGSSSFVLSDFGGVVTRGAAQSLLFRVASDIVERAGISQGRSLAPTSTDIQKKEIGMSEAVKLLGKSRQAIHLAVSKGKILGRRVGAVVILDLESVLEYKKSHP